MLYDTKRTLRNEVIPRGDMLVACLNRDKGESRSRLLALLKRCRHLPSLLKEARPVGRHVPYSDLMPYPLASRPEHRTFLRELSLLLKRYRLRWSVESVVFAGRGRDRVIQFPLVGAYGSTARGDSREILMVQQLLRLTELQALDRVRECADCQKWFMARRRDQNFCQVGCRRRKDRRQQNKEALALYQKSYRRGKRIRILKSWMRRARPSDRDRYKAEIVELEKERKALLDIRRKLPHATN
jgi:hypothetical protein